MSKPENIFEIIAKRDAQAFIEVVDEAFKSAAREASLRAHQKGIKVADGRAEEDRRPKPVKPDLQAPTLRAFFRLAEVWGLSDDEQMKLLATTDQRTLQAWKAGNVSDGSSDTLLRVSHLLNIFKAINILLPDERRADAWMRAPNGASTFANRSPIELMSDGEIESLWLVRQYLQAQLV